MDISYTRKRLGLNEGLARHRRRGRKTSLEPEHFAKHRQGLHISDRLSSKGAHSEPDRRNYKNPAGEDSAKGRHLVVADEND